MNELGEVGHRKGAQLMGNIQWIRWREKLRDTMVFTIKYRGFRFQFSHHPILWNRWNTMENNYEKTLIYELGEVMGKGIKDLSWRF